jgi:hypothetical protein
MCLDETVAGAAKACTLTELSPAAGIDLVARGSGLHTELGLSDGCAGLVSRETFESITQPGKLVLLASWRDAESASRWRPAKVSGAQAQRHRQVRIVRDYGMFDRREAPQYYPDAQDRRSPD